MLFWLLAYVYSTPGLLERIRAQTSQHVSLFQETPIEIMPMELPARSRNCHILKACVFDTYRMVNEPTSIQYVTGPITVHDGEFTHEISPGTSISASHSLFNWDPNAYADAENFVPYLFLELDKSGALVARYGRLRPWGAAASMCKERSGKGDSLSERSHVSGIWTR